MVSVRHVVVLIALCVIVISKNANAYYGNQSFDLRDDQEFVSLERRVIRAAQRLDEIKRDLDRAERKLRKNEQEVKETRKTIFRYEEIVKNGEAKASQLKNKIEQLNAKKGELKNKQTNQTNKVREVKSKYTRAESDYRVASNKYQDKKNYYTQLMNNCQRSGEQNCENRSDIQKAKSEMQNAQQDFKEKNHKFVTIKNNLKTEESKLQNIEKSLSNTKAQITSRTQELNKVERSYAEAKRNLPGERNKLNRLASEQRTQRQRVERLEVKYRDERRDYAHAKRKKEDYESWLRDEITRANSDGYNNGTSDGTNDGHQLAMELGTSKGEEDGTRDGHRSGEAAGRQRDYQNGYNEGRNRGYARGLNQGEIDGRVAGTIRGNKDAATAKAEADGEQRADRSDAAVVGSKQGRAAGFKRAEETGQRQGTPIGEKKAIEKFENAPLNQITIEGNFVGTFASEIPTYPGASQRNYRPDYWGNAKRVVKMAYRDGYIYGYHAGSESAFFASIASIYTNSYETAYRQSENESRSRTYHDEIQRGENNGDSDGYNDGHEEAYAVNFKKFRDLFANNPNVNSTEYKETYKRVEEATYQYFYEKIRKHHYVKVEKQTFDENIQEQTDKYDALRFAAVSKIYNDTSILKFESSSLTDLGINNIAARDAIYQPGESIGQNIVVKNFGKTAAVGVAININGKTSNLPNIPAQSEVTITNATGVTIPGSRSEGDWFSTEANLQYSITAERKIQGRHFKNPALGVLADNINHSVSIKYPLALGRLKNLSTILMNKTSNLSLMIENQSKRSYAGPITIKLGQHGSNYQIQDFSTINELAKNLEIQGAKISITDQKDLYELGAITAKIYKENVLLGSLKEPLKIFPRLEYHKTDGPILITNSLAKPSDTKRLFTNLGGKENVSVMDISLKDVTSQIKTDAVDKKLITLTSDKNTISTVLTSSVNSPLLIIGELNEKNIVDLPQLSEHSKLEYVFDPTDENSEKLNIYNSNPLRVEGLKGNTFVIGTNSHTFDKAMTMAQVLLTKDNELINTIADWFDVNNYFTPDSDQKMFLNLVNLKSMLEVLNINRAHEKAPRRGIFRRRDKKYLNLIKKGDDLLLHKIAKSVDSSIEEDKLAQFLFARDFHHCLAGTMDQYKPVSKVIMGAIEDASTDITKAMNKNVTKKLDKYSESLLDESNESLGLYCPFMVKKVEDRRHGPRHH